MTVVLVTLMIGASVAFELNLSNLLLLNKTKLRL